MSARILIVIVTLPLLLLLVLAGARNAADSLAQSLAHPLPPPERGEMEIPILMYHKVNPDPRTGGLGLRVPPQKFARQMEYLAGHGFHTVSLTDVVDHFQKSKPLPPRPVVITFDDGYLDNYTYAFPILKKYGFTATVFVVAHTVGKTNTFDAGRQPLNKMAGWRELKEMASYGITIGAHTLDHPRLTRLSLEEVRRQIKESKALLEAELGRPVEVFSYPYGEYNREVARVVRESGYRAAVTTRQGLAGPGDDPFTLKRVRVMGSYDLQKFITELVKHYYSSAPLKE
ncbi:peptidoglycan/xylan/chitin deacetylase (PgdA/CDA1 family) [Desulfofundulus luciae]|uniref:Peptidoglycan/xylan/chitin deacetylase (PgdA/CDA1 family) n=1 Tax=Desulfofundulus luciae TaxID=74702 RepID=A0ABU0AXD0_9FIRM|nr:polysaccharide deacetylase family protein [Desulfofundulus luciae]MDQ0285139.1 peptidoglycan/xylan/chitin deacetylase (PgdA/CDA1 family) [Desulfofundulus luciae]